MNAAGSLWNANSWHWEERNYNQWAKTYLNSLFTGLSIPTSLGSVILTEPDMKGDASIAIRKGKQIAIFDLEIILGWKLIVTENEEEKSYHGKLTIDEFSLDNLKDESYNIHAETLETENFASKITHCLEKEGVTLIRQTLKNFAQAMIAAESDSDKLKQDKQRREAEKQRMVEAELKRGVEKNQIAIQKKKEESEIKKRSMETSVPLDQSLKGQASIWNVNSYHWEEKNLTRWCLEYIKTEMIKRTFDLQNPNAELKFLDVNVQGDASISIRKERKIIVYDLKMNGGWTVTLRDTEGIVTGTTHGSFDIPDFNSLDQDDYEITMRFDNPELPNEELQTSIQEQGSNLVRNFLKEFVKELTNQG